MEDTDMTWRKASYSSNGGANCVEVGQGTAGVAVRDTTDRDSVTLSIAAGAWQAFTDALK